MPGIKRRMITVGTIIKTGRALFEMRETCEACGCLVREINRPSGRSYRKCAGRCGVIADPIPASEVGL